MLSGAILGTFPLMLSMLMGSVVKPLSQTNSVYIRSNVGRHVSISCKESAITYLQGCWGCCKAVMEAYSSKSIKVLDCFKAVHIEEIYSKSLTAPFTSMFCQACLVSQGTVCIPRYKVKQFVVIPFNKDWKFFFET